MSEGSLIISKFIFLCMWKLEVKNLTCITGLDMAVSFLDVSFYWLRFEFSIYTSTVCFWDIAKHKKICVALEYIFSFAFTEDNLCLGKEIQIAIVQSSNEHFGVVKSFVSLPSMSGVRWRNKFVGFELKNQRCARSLKSHLSHRDVVAKATTPVLVWMNERTRWLRADGWPVNANC